MPLREMSAVMITKNAADTLARTLLSLERVDEVVVYDNGSSDNTLDIARGFTNVRLHQGEFFGFGPTKNHAVSLASHDWVISIDADEVLTVDLLDELDALALDDPRTACFVRRVNLFMNKPVKHSGWGDDWLLRVFNRQVHRFNNAMVHENVELHGESRKQKFKSSMLHYAVTDIGQFLVKINRYSEIRKDTELRVYSPPMILLKSWWAFFRTYVLRLGFLDGWRGMVIAVSNGAGVFFKNIKIYAARRNF